MARAVKRQRISEHGDAVDIALTSLNENFHKSEPDDLDLDHSKGLSKTTSSLFVRSLSQTTTKEVLADHFSQSYPLKHAVVVVDRNTKASKGYGFVTFADPGDAVRARNEFDGSIIEGRRVKVEIAEPRHRGTGDEAAMGSKKSLQKVETMRRDQNKMEMKQDTPAEGNQDAQLPPRLIVRNLPWSVKTSDELSMLFRSYGKVKQAVLPQKKPGLSPGFGFVLLRGRKNAEKAMVGMNGKVVDGRTLAVDWAIDKSTWQGSQQNSRLLPENGLSKHNEDMGSHGPNVLDDKATSAKKSSLSQTSDYGFADEETSENGSNSNFPSNTPSETRSPNDLEETRAKEDYSSTLFVRNLPFNTTDETLSDHFSRFGPLRYARIVLDPETSRSRGSGFVSFRQAADARQCLRAAPKASLSTPSNGTRTSVKHSVLEDTQADPLGYYSIEGRVLQITLAVDRSEAQRLTVQGQNARDSRERDKRRLYLLAEGTISSQSPFYGTLTPSEIKLREESAKQRQALVKSNPMLHISLTRLSVRNIPRHITSKDLKALAREAVVCFAKDVKEGRRRPLSKEELTRGCDLMRAAEQARKAKGIGIVKQAQIVFEGKDGKKVGEKSGAGKSRGYGFIEFASHRWALMGLRWLNGHLVGPDSKRSVGQDDTPKTMPDRARRLIVEFAIENAQVVARRQIREEKARQHVSLAQMTIEGGNEQTEGRHTGTAVLKHGVAKKGKESSPLTKITHQQQQQGETAQDRSNSKAAKSPQAERSRIIARKRTLRRARRSSD